MRFPWRRYWRRVGVIFVIAVIVSIAATVLINDGHVVPQSLVAAVIDSVVLAIVAAFPLTQPIYRGPRR